MLRVIHTIHQAMTHYRSHQIPLHPRKPVPTAKVDPGLRRESAEGMSSPPAPRIHLAAEPRRKLFLVVMRVAVRPEIDVSLRQPQRTQILTSAGSGPPVAIEATMKVEFDNLAAPELLQEIMGIAED